MRYDEDDLLPISALQHLLFCERQAALIHVERLWAENELTVQGRQLHERADSGKRELLRGRAEGRAGGAGGAAAVVHSSGVWGKADVVEFPPAGPPRPVEYKRGKPKRDGSDAVQLCAQAICLEEMLGVSVPLGVLFYGVTRDRLEVAIDDALRARTAEAAGRMHELMRTGHTPAAALQAKCRRCSMLSLCQPSAIGRKKGQRRSAAAYAERALAAALSTTEEDND